MTGADVISAVGGMKEPPVDRFIAGYSAGAEGRLTGDQDAERVLVGLGRPGEVQGARAEPDRGRRRGRVPGRRRLRAGRARRGAGAERLGDRRRRRPVLPRAPGADECAEEASTRASSGRSRASRTAPGRAAATRTFGLAENGVGLGTISKKVPQADLDEVDADPAADRGRRDHRSSEPRLGPFPARDRGHDQHLRVLSQRRVEAGRPADVLPVDEHVDETAELAVLVEDEIRTGSAAQRLAEASPRRPRTRAARPPRARAAKGAGTTATPLCSTDRTGGSQLRRLVPRLAAVGRRSTEPLCVPKYRPFGSSPSHAEASRSTPTQACCGSPPVRSSQDAPASRVR